MSSITINSNIASLNTQRRFEQSTSSLRDSFSRLSSGLRINRASDDAAGLAVSSLLTAERRVINQGVRNLNDGISLLSIADGALSELSNISVRLAELAEQAATGSLSSVQRNALDSEAQALRDEFTRITQTTEFNNRKLFGSDFGDLKLQAGFSEQSAIESNLGGAIGTGNFELASVTSVGGVDFNNIAVVDLNGDGHQDALIAGDVASTGFANILLGNGDGSFRAIQSFAAGDRVSYDVDFGDFNGDGVLDLVTADQDSSGSRGEVSILLGNGDGSFKGATQFRTDIGVAGTASHFVEVGDVNGDGIDDIVTQGGYSYIHSTVLLGNGDGSFHGRRTYLDDVFGTYEYSRGIELVDLNGDSALDIVSHVERDGANGTRIFVRLNDGLGGFDDQGVYFADTLLGSDLTVGDINNDGILDIAESGFAGFNYFLGRGDGTFESKRTLTGVAGSIQDINGDGLNDIAGSSIYLADGEGGFEVGISITSSGSEKAYADFNEDGALDFVSVTDLVPNSTFGVQLSTTEVGVSALLEFSLKTQTGAKQSLALFEQKLNQLASQRGSIGAFEARLSSAIANASVTSENIEAARSRISDVDVANESAKLVRLNILQQAGAAVLAQANQSPSLALSLLGR